MRCLLAALVAGVLFVGAPAKSEAQRFFNYSFYPGVYAPPMYGAGSYSGPYGYRSYFNFNSFPTPYGYGAVSNYGAWQQPYMMGPYHSVYFNPYLNTYQYGTGYRNTPTYSLFYGY